MNPMLAFAASVNNTPDHSMGKFVLPWDNKDCDFVYGCADSKVFKEQYSLQQFRKVIFFNKI